MINTPSIKDLDNLNDHLTEQIKRGKLTPEQASIKQSEFAENIYKNKTKEILDK